MKFDRINVNRLDDIGYVIDKEKFLSLLMISGLLVFIGLNLQILVLVIF